MLKQGSEPPQKKRLRLFKLCRQRRQKRQHFRRKKVDILQKVRKTIQACTIERVSDIHIICTCPSFLHNSVVLFGICPIAARMPSLETDLTPNRHKNRDFDLVYRSHVMVATTPISWTAGASFSSAASEEVCARSWLAQGLRVSPPNPPLAARITTIN